MLLSMNNLQALMYGLMFFLSDWWLELQMMHRHFSYFDTTFPVRLGVEEEPGLVDEDDEGVFVRDLIFLINCRLELI